MVDATGATVDNEAELVAASARFSCPLASSYLAVSVQDLMAADKAPARAATRDGGQPKASRELQQARPPSRRRPTVPSHRVGRWRKKPPRVQTYRVPGRSSRRGDQKRAPLRPSGKCQPPPGQIRSCCP